MTGKVSALLLMALVALGLAGCSDEPTSPAKTPPSSTQGSKSAVAGLTGRKLIPDRYIVVFKYDRVGDVPGLTKTLVTAPTDSVLFMYHYALKGFAARLSPATVETLRLHPFVEQITPDEYGVADSPTWNQDRIDQHSLPLDGVYSPGRDGSGVNVYVIDSGIRKSHQEFDWGARALHGYTAINDGRGSEDCHGHGTHVAGSAAGTNWGVARGATVYSVRIADCTNITTASAALGALDWVRSNRLLPAVANLSFSWSARSDIDDAVQRVIDSGVTFITSAGNSNTDACNYSPNRKSNVLTVANSDESDWRASDSNWGSCVKLFAPGTIIFSAYFGNDTHGTQKSGTSMSSPHVAGVAALYLQGDPGAAPWKVQDAIVNSATTNVINDPRGSPNRLLYSKPAYFGVSVSGPGMISSSGWHAWEAIPEGGDGNYTYQWEVTYDNGSAQTLGTSKTQSLWVEYGSGSFTISVTSSSAGRTKAGSLYVINTGCGTQGIC